MHCSAPAWQIHPGRRQSHPLASTIKPAGGYSFKRAPTPGAVGKRWWADRQSDFHRPQKRSGCSLARAQMGRLVFKPNSAATPSLCQGSSPLLARNAGLAARTRTRNVRHLRIRSGGDTGMGGPEYCWPRKAPCAGLVSAARVEHVPALLVRCRRSWPRRGVGGQLLAAAERASADARSQSWQAHLGVATLATLSVPRPLPQSLDADALKPWLEPEWSRGRRTRSNAHPGGPAPVRSRTTEGAGGPPAAALGKCYRRWWC